MTNTRVYKNYGVYDLSTGRIEKIVLCWETEVEDHVSESQGYAEFEGNMEEYYWDLSSSEWAPKGVNGISVSPTTCTVGDAVTISGLPVPCTIRIDHQNYLIESGDGTQELEFTEEGEHILEFDVAPYLYKEVVVNVE